MSRYIEIRECGDCPHSDKGEISYCNAWDDMFAKSCPPTGIPEWCPLPVLPVMREVPR